MSAGPCSSSRQTRRRLPRRSMHQKALSSGLAVSFQTINPCSCRTSCIGSWSIGAAVVCDPLDHGLPRQLRGSGVEDEPKALDPHRVRRFRSIPVTTNSRNRVTATFRSATRSSMPRNRSATRRLPPTLRATLALGSLSTSAFSRAAVGPGNQGQRREQLRPLRLRSGGGLTGAACGGHQKPQGLTVFGGHAPPTRGPGGRRSANGGASFDRG